MAKTKVSFDMEEENLSDIKRYCEGHKIKVADFMRAAALEKYENDKEYLAIFLLHGGSIKKFVIKKSDYDIRAFQPSQEMRENVGATAEGFISFLNKNHFSVGCEIDFILAEEPNYQIKFFTKDMFF